MTPPPSDRDAPDEGSGFLSRWSRRKAEARQGLPPAEPLVPTAPTTAPASPPIPPPPGVSAAPAAGSRAASPPAATPPTEPLPTLADAAALPTGADVRRFMARGVDPQVKNAALKRLFADPHFNVMDGLDTYIDDYGKPDPIPAEMLRQLLQSPFIGRVAAPDAPDAPLAPADGEAAASAVIDADPTPTAAASSTPDCLPTPDDDAAVRLQPDAADRPVAAAPGAGEDARRAG